MDTIRLATSDGTAELRRAQTARRAIEGAVKGVHVATVVSPGQGAIAILASGSASGIRRPLGPLDDPRARRCVCAERTFARAVGDFPGAVVAAHAKVREDRIELRGLIAEEAGRWMARDAAEAEFILGDIIARELAESCRDTAGRRPREGVTLKLPASI